MPSSENEPKPSTEKKERKPRESGESILGKRAESKLLKEQAKLMAEVTEREEAAKEEEAGKDEKIYAEREKLNRIFETSNMRRLNEIEDREQTVEEKVAALEVGEAEGVSVNVTTVDKGVNQPYGIPTFLEEDEGNLYLEAEGYGMPVDFSKIEKVEFPRKEGPSAKEISELIGEHDKDYSIDRMYVDDHSVYRLEASAGGKVYDYARSGSLDSHRSLGYAIHVAEYDTNGDFVKYPEHIAEYNPSTGKWQKTYEWQTP